ncbi:hypothetical protein QUF80_05515 [Desulfococcaceae bacterium HSG8]|nr:hypothetical protein [Desulfococcaceae bacterium HSG8]
MILGSFDGGLPGSVSVARFGLASPNHCEGRGICQSPASNEGGCSEGLLASVSVARFGLCCSVRSLLLGSDWQIRTAVKGGGFANPPRASYKTARFDPSRSVRIGKSEP